ncbi:MAG: type II toxin-antitoxin system VapC family toxin [Frankiaceae bacterium]
MIVIDASAMVTLLVAASGVPAVRLLAQPLIAPSHLVIEVVSAVRNLVRADALDEPTAFRALDQLVALPVELTSPTVPRIWELRHNLTPYDAAYVALAEARSCPLVTSDARLARVPGPRCDIQLLGGLS